ncbi:hypothetical protein [Candidatus Nitrosocosmicus hydrocola]|uniref:hypothetical protein n=1 Tax=Candidatus Nitrosocosmicus hydrocola TaxID=1826872 RepID=UPI0011E59CFF|nr:hypothetical protein [Candidatus Nitrosocosmicus hydrocola]
MNKNQYLSIFILAYSILMVSAMAASPISSVFASTEDSNSNQTSTGDESSDEQPSLQTVDDHLEDCIQELEDDNTNEALELCQSADDELDRLLANTTG